MEIGKGILGNAIKSARIEKGMTQEQLAEQIGVVPMHIKNIESERRSPSVSVLFRLAKTLHFSVDDIFFPENADGQELRRKIERRLRDCAYYELNVIYKTVEALTEKSGENPES
jgi:transcriptional regulator with XRE-family HTH domain